MNKKQATGLMFFGFGLTMFLGGTIVSSSWFVFIIASVSTICGGLMMVDGATNE